jgi:MSHA biogenesis protein MshE
MNDELVDALRRNDQTAFEQAADRQPSYRPLVNHALDLARAGETTVEESMRLSGWVD